jgi:hypothetical protein
VPLPFWICTAITSDAVNETVCESVQDEPPLGIVHAIVVATPFLNTVSATPVPPTADPTCAWKFESVPAIGIGDAAAAALEKTFCEPAVPEKPVVSSASTKATEPVTL